MLFVVRCDAGFKYVYAFFKLLSNILIVDCNLYRKNGPELESLLRRLPGDSGGSSAPEVTG